MLIFLLDEFFQCVLHFFKAETRYDPLKGLRNFRVHKVPDASLMCMFYFLKGNVGAVFYRKADVAVCFAKRNPVQNFLIHDLHAEQVIVFGVAEYVFINTDVLQHKDHKSCTVV